MNILSKEEYVYKKATRKREYGKFRELTVVHSGWSIVFKNGMVDESRGVKQGHTMNGL